MHGIDIRYMLDIVIDTDDEQAHPHLTNALPPKEVKKVAPPIKRFMDIQNPGELRINEVLELLRDYRRLAGVVKNAGLC